MSTIITSNNINAILPVLSHPMTRHSRVSLYRNPKKREQQDLQVAPSLFELKD